MLISKDTKQIILEEADSDPEVNFLNDMGWWNKKHRDKFF